MEMNCWDSIFAIFHLYGSYLGYHNMKHAFVENRPTLYIPLASSCNPAYVPPLNNIRNFITDTRVSTESYCCEIEVPQHVMSYAHLY